MIPYEPWVSWRDVHPLHRGRWEEVDREAARLIGAPGVAIPSVRMGICWTLEYLGCLRHADHVLVPRFMGRCILNAINRVAFPVEGPTPKTRAVIAVHQFGLRQELEQVAGECARRGLPYLEDSPFGLAPHEGPGPGSLVKLVGFAKVLPVLKGGFAMSTDEQLLQAFRAKRAMSSPWSWAVLAALTALRHRRRAAPASILAEIAYELYPASGGDNAILRGNVLSALRQADVYERVVQERLAVIQAQLGPRALRPDATRLAYVVPWLAEGDETLDRAVEAVFARHGFDATRYHVDVNRNLFAPDYRLAWLIPLNPSLPDRVFVPLIRDLRALAASPAPQGAFDEPSHCRR